MTSTDDDEWEYEYDETETEDFYLQLDLSNVPGEQVPLVAMGRPGHPILLKSRLRALNAQVGQLVGGATDATAGPETSSVGELQLIGLDTPNPLVMYNGQLLSCHWTSTIGTDLFFVKPDPSIDAQLSPPLRSLPAAELLAMGSAKLIAKPGRLRPRDDLFDDKNKTDTLAGSSEPTLSAPTSQTTSKAQNHTFGNGLSSPTGFLAKLNEAKAKRGETSRLVISRTPNGSRLVSEDVDERSGRRHGNTPTPSGDTVMGGT